jgi:hypothetical protein
MSLIDFAEVKARCQIEQAAKLVLLQCPKSVRSCEPSAQPAKTAAHGLSCWLCAEGYDEELRRHSYQAADRRTHRLTEAKLPKEFHLSNVVKFPKKTAWAV